MGRKQTIELDEDGSATLRVTIPPSTWRLIQRFAERLKLDVEAAARIFLGHVEALISEGSTSWLAADWQRVQRDVSNESPEIPEIDQAVLHRSTKTKSGFVGVYANGAGFRATGRRGQPIGTYKSAELAAWARYKFYKANSLPYGELELDIDRLRRDGERGTDEELKEIALELARLSGTMHHYEDPREEPSSAQEIAGFAPGALEAAREALKKHDAAIDQAERPKAGRLISPRPKAKSEEPQS